MRRAAWTGTRVDAVLLAICILLALILKASTDSVREGLAAILRQTVLAPMLSLQASAEKWRSALGSFDAMVASRDSALMRAVNVPALQAENQRLANLLMLGGRLDWGFLPARVLYTAAPGRPTTVVIDVGESAGVVPLSPVVSADGLVGVVKSVDRSTSIVSLWWTDGDFSVSATSDDGKAFGIITAHRGPGADGYLLEMRNVNYRVTLKEGARIVSTGQGGVYPAMIPIGTVVGELESVSGWARTYIVRPSVMPQDVTAVIVLHPLRVANGVEGVWRSPAQADSASRVIAARGDSLARVRLQAAIKAQADSALLQMRGRGAGMPPDSSLPPP